MKQIFSVRCALLSAIVASLLITSFTAKAEGRQFAYLVSDLRIPFWDIMWRGVRAQAEQQGDNVLVFSADNQTKQELQNMMLALGRKVDGIVLSPTNSSAAVTLLKLAQKAAVPVVISDIGTQGGEHISYIESDNETGAYQLGRILAGELQARGWQQGKVGIIAIPQKRKNGKLRTQGFLKALNESQIQTAYIYQQSDFSYEETLEFSRALIRDHSDLRAIWLQGSDRYQGALDAIRDAGREGDILLICFDAEPEFTGMIQDGTLTAAGMQQPFLMGQKALETLQTHLDGQPVAPRQQLEVLAVSEHNLPLLLPQIRRNVLGLTEPSVAD